MPARTIQISKEDDKLMIFLRRLTKDFAGINFRELCFTRNFAGIYFRKSALFKDFAGPYFMVLRIISVKIEQMTKQAMISDRNSNIRGPSNLEKFRGN